ncbi:MAG: hypothetical protein ABGY42_17650, partial [bacterium]
QFEGAAFSRRGVERSRTRLLRLPFIEDAQVETEPVPGSDDLVDVKFDVRERAAGTIQAGVGFSDAQGFLINGSVTHSNFRGTGHRLSLRAETNDFAQVVSRSRRDGLANPRAQVAKDVSVDELLAAPYFSQPLRKHDLPPISDGASMMLIARGDRARELTDKPVWITGIDHRMESGHPGLRDLADSTSTRIAAQKLGIDGGAYDVAELCVRYSPEEILLKEALGLTDSTRINPSGGPLCGHPVMATGLARVCEAARLIRNGIAGSAIAHAASGPALQQNLVCTLEGDA